jgi:hypothetical protein
MNVQWAIEHLNYQLIARERRPLNAVESAMIDGIWKDNTYHQIALDWGYSEGYLTRVVAPELFRKLSELLEGSVTKKNCRILLAMYLSGERKDATEIGSALVPIYPSGAVPLHSPYYIDRTPAEEQIVREIHKPGALVRVKAPREMGKTSLLLRVLDRLEQQGIHTVHLDLAWVDREILGHLDRFLRWLCTNISHELGFDARLVDYWNEDIGSKVSCSFYLRDYLLDRLDCPLVLAFDQVDRLFEYPTLVQDVVPLWRSWYEEAKRGRHWAKLRQIVVHSSDLYLPLQFHQSPFNVGLPVQLSPFTLDQLNTLAHRYGLRWTGEEAKDLMRLVNGHPALCHMALYHLSLQEITLSELLANASCTREIYHDHLQHHWQTLQREPELTTVFQTLLNDREPILLEGFSALKLTSLGLIHSEDNGFTIACNLYRQYFQWRMRTID